MLSDQAVQLHNKDPMPVADSFSIFMFPIVSAGFMGFAIWWKW
jgi:hypothetical protein